MDANKLIDLAIAYKKAVKASEIASQNWDNNHNKSPFGGLAITLTTSNVKLCKFILSEFIMDFSNISTANPYEIHPLYRLAMEFQNVAIKGELRDNKHQPLLDTVLGRNAAQSARYLTFTYCKNHETVERANIKKARELHDNAFEAILDYIASEEFAIG